MIGCVEIKYRSKGKIGGIKMRYERYEDTYVLRVDRGEEVVEKIKEMCEKENIELAEITGLGAANSIEVGLFNTKTKEYKTKVLEGMFEITSLVGNVTNKDGEVYSHLHINISDETNIVKGGHLVKCRISATSEIFVRKINGKVGRKFNEEIGLNLLDY